MPVLPIPMIISLLLFGFLIQRVASRETHITILALIASCALQGAVIALVPHYGFVSLRPLQAMMATTIPPIAWAAFITAAGGDIRRSSLIWHGIGPLLALFCLLFSPFLLDALIPLSFSGYGLSMLLHMWRGEDSLLHSRLESGSKSLLAWRIIAASLIASAVCDVLIAYGMAQGEQSVILWIPSVVSSLSLLSLGILSLSHAIESQRDDDEEFIISPEDVERDQLIVAKLDEYVKLQKPFLDPDLTLVRLSRKIIIPAKQLSTAINRIKGENVSRYINRHRIIHSCEMMTKNKSVTEAMFSSGFNTKSNFNREFLRVKSESPSKWLSKKKIEMASRPKVWDDEDSVEAAE